MDVERLKELARADREGRVVVLPCRRGDELWVVGVGSVYPTVVGDISTLNGRTVLNTSASGVVSASDIGKDVFLTREEAEKALRRDDHD